MMRKFVTAFILIPLAIVLIVFAVANREIVTIAFDPFDSTHPAFALKLPLFILIFVLIGIGMITGGMITWLKQHKWRARARRAEAEARALRGEIDALKEYADGARSGAPSRRDPFPPLFLPPAA